MKEYVVLGTYDVQGHPNAEIIFSTTKHTEILKVRTRLLEIRDRTGLSTRDEETPSISGDDAEFLEDRSISPVHIHKIRNLFIRILSTS